MTITLFNPHSGQQNIINNYADSSHKFGVASFGRQFGKTILAENLIVYWLLSSYNQKGAWVSPNFKQCRKVFKEIVSNCYEIIVDSNKSELNISFINGSTLQFLSGKSGDSIRGYSFNYMVIDEAAIINETVLNENILPTLTAIGKKCFIISTPKSKNWFYNYHIKGREENPNYISFEGKSSDNPYADKKFIELMRLSYPIEIFLQEYEAKFSESTNDVFRGIDNICTLREFSRNFTEPVWVGIDVGLSQDYTVITVMNAVGKVVDILRFNGGSINDASDKIINFLKQYKVQGGYIEVNNIGKAIYENIKNELNKIKPFTTTQDSKFEGIKKLISDIELMQVELPTRELFPQLYNELSAYTYKISANGKLSFLHPNGINDDCVDSLWLANLSRLQLSNNKIYINGKYI